MSEAAPQATASNFDSMMGSAPTGAAEPANDNANRQPRAKRTPKAAQVAAEPTDELVHPGQEPLVPEAAKLSEQDPEDIEQGEPELDPEVFEDEQPEEPEAPQYDLSGPDLPQELYDKHITVTVDGKTMSVPIGEAAKGFMRLADYTRKTTEVKQLQTKYKQATDNLSNKLKDWSDPRNVAQTCADLEKLGIPIYDFAAHAGLQWQAEQKLTPTERQAKAEAKKLKDELEELRAMHEEARGKNSRTTEDQQVSEWRGVYEKHAPSALQAHGLKQTPYTMQVFKHSLDTLWADGMPLTEAIIRDAAQATKEQLQDLQQQHEGQQKPQTQQVRRTPPVQKVGGGPSAPSRRAGGTVEDFNSKFGWR